MDAIIVRWLLLWENLRLGSINESQKYHII